MLWIQPEKSNTITYETRCTYYPSCQNTYDSPFNSCGKLLSQFEELLVLLLYGRNPVKNMKMAEK